MLKFILVSLIALGFGTAMAEDELDSESQEALMKTQELLKDKNQRQESIAKDSRATQADAFLKNLTGDAEATDEVYLLAAEVFSIIVKDANGDVSKMEEALSNFSRSPASFADKWTSEQKAKLQALSDKLGHSILKP